MIIEKTEELTAAATRCFIKEKERCVYMFRFFD